MKVSTPSQICTTSSSQVTMLKLFVAKLQQIICILQIASVTTPRQFLQGKISLNSKSKSEMLKGNRATAHLTVNLGHPSLISPIL